MVHLAPSPLTRGSLGLVSILMLLAGVFGMHVLDCQGAGETAMSAMVKIDDATAMSSVPVVSDAPDLMSPATRTGGLPILALCLALALGALALLASRAPGRARYVRRTGARARPIGRLCARILDPPDLHCLSIQRC